MRSIPVDERGFFYGEEGVRMAGMLEQEKREIDLFWLRECLRLAQKARGFTAPNPMVGAVVVKDGRMVGEGYHQKAGTPHAEIHALRQARDLARGATLYVSLEPCCHYGKTPPCTDAIMKAGIQRVVCCMQDPNPKVGGHGLALLRAAGIAVECGLLEQEAQQINEIFMVNMTQKRPFVALKAALTLDGKMTAQDGSSKWITGEEARKHGQYLRHQYGAVLTGSGTVLKDNPQMNVRLENLLQPKRIVLDRCLKVAWPAKILQVRDAPTIVITASEEEIKKAALKEKGVTVCTMLAGTDGFVLPDLLQMLYEMGIRSVLVEAGPRLCTSFMQQDLVDKYYLFYAPKLVGGEAAPSLWGGAGCPGMAQAKQLKQMRIEPIGEDILISAYGKTW